MNKKLNIFMTPLYNAVTEHFYSGYIFIQPNLLQVFILSACHKLFYFFIIIIIIAAVIRNGVIPNCLPSKMMFFLIVYMLFVCKYVLLFISVARVMIQVPGCKLP